MAIVQSLIHEQIGCTRGTAPFCERPHNAAKLLLLLEENDDLWLHPTNVHDYIGMTCGPQHG